MIKYSAMVPYDPIEDFYYINAVGSNETEAMVNLDLCESSDEVLKRIVFVPIEISVLKES